MESSSTEKDLGVLVVSRFIMSQQYALVAKNASGVLRCIKWSIKNRLIEGLLSL